MNSPYRTGSSVEYHIEIFCDVADMPKIREACADLIEGIDQSKAERGPFYGEDGMLHTDLIVEPSSVGEAVRRINALGFCTDEDPEEEGEDG